MQRHLIGTLVVLGVAAGYVMPAGAHVLLKPKEARAGSDAEIAFIVPHGCDGSATTGLRVRIPDGVVGVKPQAKSGWTLDTKAGEVAWTGGRLPDKVNETFGLQVTLPDTPGATLYFPVVQECEKGIHRWIEIPSVQQVSDRLREPAPALKLTPKTP